ncbi:MAG: hypothetical protein KAZ30_02495 [Candidatus Magasanikbacteria bacterium]|nr:hypothetical protein [Candidatus Magasanikbacteria bacterium]
MGDHDQQGDTRRHIVVVVQGHTDPKTGSLLPTEMHKAFIRGQSLASICFGNLAERVYIPKTASEAARATAFGIIAGIGNVRLVDIRVRGDLDQDTRLTEPPGKKVMLSDMLGTDSLAQEGRERMRSALKSMARYISEGEILLVVMDSLGAELAGDPKTTTYGLSPFAAMLYVMDVGLNTSDNDVTFVSSEQILLRSVI